MNTRPSPWWPAHPAGQIGLCLLLIAAFCALAFRPVGTYHTILLPNGTLFATFAPVSGLLCAGIWYTIVIALRFFIIVQPAPPTLDQLGEFYRGRLFGPPAMQNEAPVEAPKDHEPYFNKTGIVATLCCVVPLLILLAMAAAC